MHSNILVPLDSEPHSLCYIETANLDGETNLKIRQALPTTAKLLSVTALRDLQGILHCELPNRHLYEFNGTLRLTKYEPLALGTASVVPPKSTLRLNDFGFVRSRSITTARSPSSKHQMGNRNRTLHRTRDEIAPKLLSGRPFKGPFSPL